MHKILDLELALVWNTLEPTLLSNAVNALSYHIKKQPLFTLDSTFSILANNLESNQFLLVSSCPY
jgi:hypothetical protein